MADSNSNCLPDPSMPQNHIKEGLKWKPPGYPFVMMKLFLGHLAALVPLTDVRGAWLYAEGVKPTEQPGLAKKLLGGLVFWIVCYGWHVMQCRWWLQWHIPGEPGQKVTFQRVRGGEEQVLLNMLAVLLPSIFCFLCYVFAKPLMEWLVNPIFTPKWHLGQLSVTAFMFTMAFTSNLLMTSNWVVWSVCVFTFVSWVFIGRSIWARRPVKGRLEHIGPGLGHADLQLLRPALRPLWPPGDEAFLLRCHAEQWLYVGNCGRANLFRPDVMLVFLTAYVWRMPWFILGTGNYNQCVGWAELSMIFYIPFGYPSLASFGFRLSLGNAWTIGAMLVLTLWPFVNLCLGGKGCGTLTHLVLGDTLPEIWNSSAREISFNRGFETCSLKAYHEGGETLLVASTTVAAWVHIMSNYSFLFGFGYGLWQKVKTKHQVVEMTLDSATDQAEETRSHNFNEG